MAPEGEYYEDEKVTGYVSLTCIIAALSGLMFGSDLGAVICMDGVLSKFFPMEGVGVEEQSNRHYYCRVEKQIPRVFISSLYVAALAASMSASWLAKRFGRRISMMAGGLVLLMGSILSAMAADVSMFFVGRIWLGIGMGLSAQSVPIYVSENVAFKNQIHFNLLFQLSLSSGIFISNIVNALTVNKLEQQQGYRGGWGWRVSLGTAAAVAILIIIFSALKMRREDEDEDEDNDEREMEGSGMQAKHHKKDEDEDEDEEDGYDDDDDEEDEDGYAWRRCRQSIPLFVQRLLSINMLMLHAPGLYKTLNFPDFDAFSVGLISATLAVIVLLLRASVLPPPHGPPLRQLTVDNIMLQCHIYTSLMVGIEAVGVLRFAAREGPKLLRIMIFFRYMVGSCSSMAVAAFADVVGPLGWLLPPAETSLHDQIRSASIHMFFNFSLAHNFLAMLCAFKFSSLIFFLCFTAAHYSLYFAACKMIPQHPTHLRNQPQFMDQDHT